MKPHVIPATSALALLLATRSLPAEPAGSPDAVSGPLPAPLNWTTQQDHRNMMEQLGITRLRPGPSGQPGATNAANYDPAKANPYPDLPELLTLKNGTKVTTAEQWWQRLRQPQREAPAPRVCHRGRAGGSL